MKRLLLVIVGIAQLHSVAGPCPSQTLVALALFLPQVPLLALLLVTARGTMESFRGQHMERSVLLLFHT